VRQPLTDIWVYLSATPLLFLTLTLLVYQAAYWLYRRAGFHPLLNPVAVSIALLVALLRLTGTRYETYFGGAQFVHCTASARPVPSRKARKPARSPGSRWGSPGW